MNEKLYSATEAAALIGLAPLSVASYCRRHDIGRVIGSTRVLTEADIERLRQRPGRGHPSGAPRTDHLRRALVSRLGQEIAEVIHHQRDGVGYRDNAAIQPVIEQCLAEGGEGGKALRDYYQGLAAHTRQHVLTRIRAEAHATYRVHYGALKDE